MRYIALITGYLVSVSFGAEMACYGMGCTEYTGTVPAGYSSLADWFTKEGDKLYRWKIVDGNLTLDPDAEGPEEVPIRLTTDEVGHKDGRLSDYMFEAVTQEEYDALVAAGKVNEKTPYLIVSDSA